MSLVAYPAKTDRSAILTAALEQVEREGVEKLAVRSIAAKLGLAPNALYRYFESLAALEAAVAEEARRQMLEAMEVAVEKEPAQAIRAICEAYLRFALNRPRVFALYLKTYGAEEHTPQCKQNTAFFLKYVSRVYGEEQADEASHALWAFLHGSAVLLDAGLISEDRAFANLQFGLKMWIDGATKLPEKQ